MQQNDQQTPETQINVAQAEAVVEKIGRPIAAIGYSFLIFVSLFFLLFGGIFGSSIFDRSETATINGIVTSVNRDTQPPTANESASTTCTLGYTFTIKDNIYNGKTSTSTDGYCSQTIGSTVSVHYKPSDPTHNSIPDSFGNVLGVVFFVIGLIMFVGGILALRRLRRSNTANRSATSAQMELIQNGFQELGDFWEPHHMTQAEAEQTIADINQRLAIQHGKQTPPSQTS